jgi:tetratricopeptide (TPR) repeat protein
VALALFFAGAAGGLVIYENVERNERLELAQSYIASAEYEKAMQVYQNLDEEELYLQTKYNYGIWYLEQNEFYKSREIFRELAEVEYSDAALKILQVNYAWGVDCEEKGDLTTAAGIYEDILDYEDARQRYQHCCYALGCKDAERLAGWEHAVEWFQKAGDYQDASQLAIYYQARILGQENLLEAENLLRQLPRDFLDVDTMLTAIENYRDWNGTYSLTKSSGKDPKNYQKAELVLVYHRLTSPADAHIKWKVVYYLGNKGYTQYSDGEMPKNGTLKFNVGETYEYHFSITQKKIEMVTLEPYGNYTDDKKEHTYIFEAIN